MKVKKLEKPVSCHSCKVATANYAYRGKALCSTCLRKFKMRDELIRQ